MVLKIEAIPNFIAVAAFLCRNVAYLEVHYYILRNSKLKPKPK
jgi:hypothetical protein